MTAEAPDRVAVAEQIYARRTNFSPYAVLSLCPGGSEVTPQTPLNIARQNYMRLSLLVHPDKLRGYDKATEVFQLLVRAFEQVANPMKGGLQAAAPRPAAKRAPRSPAKPKAKSVAKPAAKKNPAKRRAKSDSEASDESESEDTSASGSDGDDEEDEDDDEIDYAAVGAPVADSSEIQDRWLNATDLSKRNADCVRSIIKCPKCSDRWQPDDNRLYTLFMGYGHKIHCQTCLLKFGTATAIHVCPHCNHNHEYDPSTYHQQQSCVRCRRSFGYMMYRVDSSIIAAVNQQNAAEAHAMAAQEEREARRNARHGGGDEDKLLQLVGQCIIDEQCPLCYKEVHRDHKSHVRACMSSDGAGKAKTPKVRSFIINDEKPPKKKVSAPRAKAVAPAKRGLSTKAKPAAAKPKSAKPKPKAARNARAKKRRARSSSEESSEEDDDPLGLFASESSERKSQRKRKRGADE